MPTLPYISDATVRLDIKVSFAELKDSTQLQRFQSVVVFKHLSRRKLTSSTRLYSTPHPPSTDRCAARCESL